MTPTHARSASGRCRKTPAAGGAQGFFIVPCLPALCASRAEPANIPHQPSPAISSRRLTGHAQETHDDCARVHLASHSQRQRKAPARLQGAARISRHAAETALSAQHSKEKAVQGPQTLDPARAGQSAAICLNSRPAPAGRAFLPGSGAGIASRSVRGDINKSHALRCQPPSAVPSGAGSQPARSPACFARSALFLPQLFEAADNDGCPAPARGVSCNGRHFVTRRGNASNRRQYARAGLHLSPLSGGCTHADGLFRGRYQCWRRGAECSHPSAARVHRGAAAPRHVQKEFRDETYEAGQAARLLWLCNDIYVDLIAGGAADLIQASAKIPRTGGVAQCAMQGDETPLRLSPLSGGVPFGIVSRPAKLPTRAAGFMARWAHPQKAANTLLPLGSLLLEAYP